MGSKKRFLAAAALATIGAAGCVNGDATQGQVVEALTNADATEAQAECVGVRLENGLSQDEFNEVAKAAEIDDLVGTPIAGSEQDLHDFTVAVLDQCFENPETAAADAGTEGDTEGEGEGDQGTEGSDGGTTETTAAEGGE